MLKQDKHFFGRNRIKNGYQWIPTNHLYDSLERKNITEYNRIE
jgi:hypothetical protein